MKTTLISFGFCFIVSLFTNKALAQSSGTLTVIVDQTSSTVTVVDAIGRKTVLPARTALPDKRLDQGLYELVVNTLPECNIKSNGYCEKDLNGLYDAKPDQLISTLAGWGQPNKAVALQMFFVPVKITKKSNAIIPKVKNGYTLIPAFHSEIVTKDSNGRFQEPPENITQGFVTQGCVRLGYKKDLKFLYTQFLYQLGKGGKIKIYVN